MVVAVVASLGQKEFAEKVHFVNQIKLWAFDLSPWLAPVVFDVSVAALLGGGLHWAKKRHSPWPWWIAAAGIAGLSVVTNLQHTGWQITAPASAGLFVIWFLRLYFQYQQIKRDREVQDSASDEFLSTDMLFDVAPQLAKTAWMIARTKPLEAGLAYRHAQGDHLLTKRELAILLGRHYNTIYDDQLYRLTNPQLFPAPTAAAPAGSETDSKDKPKTGGKVHWWNRRRLKDARRRAAMTAEDEVDRYLGLTVIERTGIILPEITYQQRPEAAPLFTKPAASAARPVTPPISAAETGQLPNATRVRRRLAAAPSAPTLRAVDNIIEATEVFEAKAPDGTIHTFEKPPGNGGVNWKRLDGIKGLEGVYIDPTVDCGCAGTKPCPYGLKLADHVMRRGKHIEAVIATAPDWATRADRFGKPDAEAAGVPGSSGQMQVAGLFNHLRLRVAAESSSNGNSNAS